MLQDERDYISVDRMQVEFNYVGLTKVSLSRQFMLFGVVYAGTMAETPDAVGDSNPLDQQRELMNLLSQETRHQIIQTILGHPEHLPSADELDYIIADKTKKSITDQLDRLQDEDILDEYTYEPNRSTRGLPWKFYGPTEYGIEILGQFNYLRGVPMVRAVIKKTRTTEKIERHMNAPRPPLPPAVVEALRLQEEGTDGVRPT